MLSPVSPGTKRRQKIYNKLKNETPEGMPIPAARLRFPIIPKNIEYLDIIKNKQTIKSYKDEIAGLSWRAVNEKIFTDGIPAGKYSYGMKFKANDNIYRGFIKSVDPKGERVSGNQDDNLKTIKQTIESLKDSLKEKTNQSNIGIDYIINSMQKSHDAECSIYKMEIANLKDKIAELKQEIGALDLQLDNAERIINEFKENGSNNKLTETLLGLLNNLTGKNPQLPDLKRKG